MSIEEHNFWDRTYETLEKLRNLEDNWDSYGAKRISEKCIHLARCAFLLWQSEWLNLTNRPSVLPLCLGGVGLEWLGKDFSLEVEIGDETIVMNFEAYNENIDEYEYYPSTVAGVAAMAERTMRYLQWGQGYTVLEANDRPE